MNPRRGAATQLSERHTRTKTPSISIFVRDWPRHRERRESSRRIQSNVSDPSCRGSERESDKLLCISDRERAASLAQTAKDD